MSCLRDRCQLVAEYSSEFHNIDMQLWGTEKNTMIDEQLDTVDYCKFIDGGIRIIHIDLWRKLTSGVLDRKK